MDDREFEEIVIEAIKTLPREFREKIENVSVLISDWPDREQIKIANLHQHAHLLLGLYQGIPQTRRGYYGIGNTLPDKITIFKLPILMIARFPGEIKKQIKDTVIHEIAHHFGLSEEAIKDAKRHIKT